MRRLPSSRRLCSQAGVTREALLLPPEDMLLLMRKEDRRCSTLLKVARSAEWMVLHSIDCMGQMMMPQWCAMLAEVLTRALESIFR